MPARALPAELAPIIAEHGVPERLLKKAGPNFPTLAKAIVFQAGSAQHVPLAAEPARMQSRGSMPCACAPAGGTA